MFDLRAEGKIRHCRFQEEASQFTIGSATFETMTELISYYENNPLYRRMKLKYAINDEILRQIGEVSNRTRPLMTHTLITHTLITHTLITHTLITLIICCLSIFV